MDVLKLNKLYHCMRQRYRGPEDDYEGSGLNELEENYIVVSLVGSKE